MIVLPNDGKPALFMMIGLPATGKSTIAKDLAEQMEIPLVAYDKLREAAAGDDVPPGMGHKFLDWASDMVGWYLHQRKSVVYDAHNLNRASRQGMLAAAKALGAHVFAVWTTCDLKTLTTRLQEAECPLEVFNTARAVFERPSVEEGFLQISMIETGTLQPHRAREREQEEVLRGDD